MSIADDKEERLSLQADISQIAQVPSWIERLSATYRIPERVQFASDLCLEEIVSNIIIHGYGATKGEILLRFINPRPGCFVFIVEDDAPHFNPLEQPESPPSIQRKARELAAWASGSSENSQTLWTTNGCRLEIV